MQHEVATRTAQTGFLPPKMKVLFITGQQRTGRWLAEALAADSASEVKLDEVTGVTAGLARLREIQARYPSVIRAVRGAGMLFAIQVRHVVKPQLLPGQQELVQQIGTALAVRTLHLQGVHVCFSLNSAQVLRLSPALNMPPELFDEMFDRIERTADRNRAAWQMLPKTPLGRLLRLAKLALETT